MPKQNEASVAQLQSVLHSSSPRFFEAEVSRNFDKSHVFMSLKDMARGPSRNGLVKSLSRIATNRGDL